MELFLNPHDSGGGDNSSGICCVRPSLLDPDLPQEPSVAPCRCTPHVAVLYLLNRPVAIIHATSIDQASLDSWLTCLRMRAPRAIHAA